jgi:NAD(P)H-dependent glutamate synthase small subunit
MGNPTGFITHARRDGPKRPVAERIRDQAEVEGRLSGEELEQQASRCMDCGIPFCHMHGCPLHNLVPEFNDMVYRKQWRRALALLHATNNFPEITGRICPALCEAACTLSVNRPAVAIREIEVQIVERGWERGWIRAERPARRSGKGVAVVGSGPAGLAAAQQLARRGHDVVVFERAPRAGGILRYGIPDFKLDKGVIDRRIAQMTAEGVTFETGVDAGVDLSARYMRRSFDAILIAAGSRVPRDLAAPGRELAGVEFAMEFLTQQNRRSEGEALPEAESITARGKNVVVIGGGDTGADCIGACRRQGAREVYQIELLPEPPRERRSDNPWPEWPRVLRTSTSHDEGCARFWGVLTKEFAGRDGRLERLRCVRIEWTGAKFTEVPGSAFELKAELALLAMGFTHVEHGPLVRDLGLELDARGNIRVDARHMTSAPGVFAAGDSVLGASLVVRAIDLGRKAAAEIDVWLGSPART